MRKIKIFISYSHKDEKFKEQLVVHLSSLKRRDIIEEWHDRKLVPGQEWDGVIKQELLDSEIILLLISSDFLASNYCYDVEIKKAMERHDNGDSVVIPVILRPCDWKELPFSKILGLPTDGRPLSKWTNIDEGFVDVIDGIKERIKYQNNSLNRPETPKKNKDSISYPYDVIVCRLPRGYVILEQINYREDSGWAITAHYCNYKGDFIHGTHYHESYRNHWETPEGQDSQFKKLGIPISDWNFADTVLNLIIDLRGRSESNSIEDVLKNYKGKYEYIDYYKKDSKINNIVVPDEFVYYYNTGEIRDIIERLRIEPWKNYDLVTLHETFESLRRQAYLLLWDKLESDHPSLIFVKEIVDEYNPDFEIEQLRKWSNKFSDAIYDTMKYIK